MPNPDSATAFARATAFALHGETPQSLGAGRVQAREATENSENWRPRPQPANLKLEALNLPKTLNLSSLQPQTLYTRFKESYKPQTPSLFEGLPNLKRAAAEDAEARRARLHRAACRSMQFF